MRTTLTVSAAAVLSAVLLGLPAASLGAVQTMATPEVYRCEGGVRASPVARTPEAGMGDMSGAVMGGMMETPGPMMGGGMMGTPDAPMEGVDHAAMDLDLMYIDMMIPHHESIIAMAQAALPRLQDERLREIAQAVVDTQQPEIEELREVRQRYYGDPNPMPMDPATMAAMDEMMPGVGDPDAMAFQMDAAAQVAAICAAEDADRAFIDLAIPHHQMAVAAAEAVVDRATHPEIRENAEQVIAAQEREIEELAAIRQELYGSATPEAVGTGA